MKRWLSAETPEGALEQAITWKDKLWNWFTDMDMWQTFMFSALRIIIIFLLTRLFVKIIYKVIDRSLERREKGRLQVNPADSLRSGNCLRM